MNGWGQAGVALYRPQDHRDARPGIGRRHRYLWQQRADADRGVPPTTRSLAKIKPARTLVSFYVGESGRHGSELRAEDIETGEQLLLISPFRLENTDFAMQTLHHRIKSLHVK